MNYIITILSLPLALVDWVYSWTAKPLDNWISSLSPFKKIYISMFIMYYYIVYLINKTRKEFYDVLTDEQKKQFNDNRYSFSNDLTFFDYLKGCWFGIGFLVIFYYIYKWIVTGIIFLLG